MTGVVRSAQNHPLGHGKLNMGVAPAPRAQHWVSRSHRLRFRSRSSEGPAGCCIKVGKGLWVVGVWCL